MSTPATQPVDQNARWDLEPIVGGQGSDGALTLAAQTIEQAQAFTGRYRTRVGALSDREFTHAMKELAAIRGSAQRIESYAGLRFAAASDDQDNGKLMATIEEQLAAINSMTLFFELEWAEFPAARAAELLGRPELGFCCHHLRRLRRRAPHLLSEPEERVLAERDPTSRTAWQRLLTEQLAEIRVELDAQHLTIGQAIGQLQDPDRHRRRCTAEAITAALAPGLKGRAFITNTLIQEHAVTDRLRSYPHWLAKRNLDNETSDDAVEAMLTAVRGHYRFVERWYQLKARILGLDRLATYDRFFPISDQNEMISYQDARELVTSAYRDFSPVAGEIVERFFTGAYIDAAPRTGKSYGAFCYPINEVHPYLLLNFTGRRADVMTMAHELGHGVHHVLASPRGIFHEQTPVTVSETASVFGEELVFERLLAHAAGEDRLTLLAGRIEASISKVFRQTAMHQFEAELHTRRREQGELSVEEICGLWAETQQELFGAAIKVDDGYSSWWSYIPHFTSLPGYLYAYPFGQLLSLSAYARYRHEGQEFVPRYLQMLAAGGSRPPGELAAMIGIDLADPSFWEAGLQLIERQLDNAELLAGELGGVVDEFAPMGGK